MSMWNEESIQSRLDRQKASIDVHAHAASPDPPLRAIKPKPVVIGIYGISGCGKTHLLRALQEKFDATRYRFEDGSARLSSLMKSRQPFDQLPRELKCRVRQDAIHAIADDCHANRQVGIVAGHYMFLSPVTAEPDLAWTGRDTSIYTHILYLDTAPEVIADRRKHDTARNRVPLGTHQLKLWQDVERENLQKLCAEYGIWFSVVTEQTSVDRVAERIRDFSVHNPVYNLNMAETRLDEVVKNAGGNKLETMLVIDGDKTLAAEDSGELFWKAAGQGVWKERNPFKGPYGYDYFSFRQATLMVEDIADVRDLNPLYERGIKPHQEFVTLLEEVGKCQHVKAIVLTSGSRKMWEKILDTAGLFNAVSVVGGGRLADGFIVNGPVKTALVARLQQQHHLHVSVFGDGPLDLGMLGQADEAYVVVGEKAQRSQSMEDRLRSAIRTDGLRAKQVLLPSSAEPMLDDRALPIVKLQDAELVRAITAHRPLRLIAATDTTASQLLMAPTRNADIHGKELRQAHHDVGRYLATQFVTLPGVLGLEDYDMPHVQAGKTTKGHRLLHERQTLIIPLMRGGEPMAFGVSEAFPQAMFLHAKEATDLTAGHLQVCRSVILVDGVINTGKSLLPFVDRIRTVAPDTKIVVVAGVVQQEATEECGAFVEGLKGGPQVTVVALRVSENRFAGKGGTDTGHRLFNTTHLD
ncbi:Uracil phosphoribosyltransferase [Teratosphaeria destructans]|uniref:Uracil phosphoribosyltransferase n=1 Tax=Teratosphaeria destructans TaxID=418781 RepID=A0A9W7W4T7_9PEZI|nr:Uracil phosphoribosyltransferase [Teratosphaeria destructans]